MVLLLVTLAVFCPRSNAQSGDSKPKSLTVLNYQTGWSLDASGYHPAVYLLLENISGHDLSGETIKVQGKFTDIHTLEPSIARMEVRRSLKPMQQFPLAIVSPQVYELPREVSYWPILECKIMARVGNVGDEGTEYLLITKIESTTQTQDDAFQKLNELTSYNRRSGHSNKPPAEKERSKPSAPIKPLMASADKLKPAAAFDNKNDSKSESDLFAQKSLPGLGDDFYNFEQSFGLPLATDTHNKDMTWAKFKHMPSSTDIMVGSREHTGKADMIVLLMPKNQTKEERPLVERAKIFAGKLKSQSLGPSLKSVKYLPSGRLEVTTTAGLGYKIYLLKPPHKTDKTESLILVLSRMSKEADVVVRSQIKDNEVLKTLPIDSN